MSSEAGVKFDNGKIRASLIMCSMARALEAVCEIGTFGANKYTDDGWLEVPNGEQRYTDALFRHMFLEAKGSKYDDDSGLRHAAHTAWNALARLDIQLRREDYDTLNQA